ncbi:MAG: DMT family transporter [Pseudomonadota bacterium]
MMGAMVLFPFMDAFSKSLSGTYPPELITWARNLVHVAIVLPLVLMRESTGAIVRAIGAWQLVRGVAFLLMTAFYIAGLRWMPLADAMAIVFFFPLIVTALSGVFLGEKVGLRRWSAVVIAFFGVCLIIRPGFSQLNAGALLLLAAAFSAAVYTLLTRKLRGTASSLVQALLPPVVGSAVLSLAVPFAWVMPSAADAGVLLLIGLLAAAGHMLLILAYERAEASLAVPLTYSQLALAVLLGFLMFGDIPAPLTWAGIVIVAGAGVFVSLRERRLAERT